MIDRYLEAVREATHKAKMTGEDHLILPNLIVVAAHTHKHLRSKVLERVRAPQDLHEVLA